MADLKNIAGSLGGMPPKKLIAMAAVLVLTIAAVVLVYSWSQQAGYQLLYGSVSEEDAGQIIRKLTEMRVPYKTGPGGIMVPGDRVYELRLQLASQGLPQGGGVGFELFDKTSFTMTDFVQKLNFRRALQGELSRSIRSLGEVEQARVHLVVPEKSLFSRTDERPKASVLVKLRAGRRLSQGQVRGIVHLVSSSVEALDPNDVAVVDSNGEMLTQPSDGMMAGSSNQLEYQRGYEKEMESRIASILEPVVGKGKVRVKAAATMDFTHVEKTEERYDPDSQVVRSETRSLEKNSNSTAGGGGGVPGVASNVPGKIEENVASAGASAASANSSRSERKNETVNYEISKTVSRIVVPVGELKRLSVVALVDGTYTAAEGAPDKKYAPRSEQDLAQFEEMVKKAVGFNAGRGDEVKVINMQFEPAVAEEMAALAGEEPSPSVLPLAAAAKYAVPLVAVVLLFLFVVKPLMRVIASPGSGGAGPVMLPQSVAQLEQAMQPRQISSREQLVDWVKKNPKDAQSLVKGWLEEK